MIIFKKAKQLSQYIDKQKNEGKQVGFVPTMGALHQGHLSLINESNKSNDLTVCSIFVNPTQFNNPDDLKHYPVSTETDIEQLISRDCDILFLPSVEEMYPPGYVTKYYALGDIETRLEGHYRPGHFQGVCQAVDRLIELVQPSSLYLGQKDYQQCMVIRKLLELTGRDKHINLQIVSTVREADGLAMSSRNLRLSKEQRQSANSIFKELSVIKENLYQYNLDELKTNAHKHLTDEGFKVDYIEIANADDLSTASSATGRLVALAAASTGNVRLIDNIVLN